MAKKLIADPPSVEIGSTSTLTASGYSKTPPLPQITFSIRDANGNFVAFGTPVEAKDGSATIPSPEIQFPASGNMVFVAATSTPNVVDAEAEITVFETADEAKLDLALKALSRLKTEQQEQDRSAAQKATEVKDQEQQIELLKKKAAAPPSEVVDSIVNAYDTALSLLKPKLATTELTLTQAEAKISKEIGKAKSDELASEYAKIKGAIKDHESKRDRLQTEINDLDAKVGKEETAYGEKKTAWDEAKKTQSSVDLAVANFLTRVNNLSSDVDQAVTSKDNKRLSDTYRELLKVKEEQAEVKKQVIEKADLGKKLSETWQQAIAQKQVVTNFRDQKMAKSAEKKATLDALTELKKRL